MTTNDPDVTEAVAVTAPARVLLLVCNGLD
jgi:hypothetical protein